MITAIAIDDEPLALNVIKAFCERIDFVSLKRTFTETSEALKFLKDNPVDLLFLDVNMPAISGIDFYKKVEKGTMVIFTTAHSEYALEGFNLNAIDYLLKPFEYNRFLQAVEKVRDYMAYSQYKDNASSQFLFVRVDYSMTKINVAEIEYIEGLDNYIKFHFNNQKTLLVRMSMKNIMEKLPAEEFIRVHRSFIVRLSSVRSVRNKVIHLDHIEIPIGTNYVDQVMKLFKDS